MYIKYAEIQHYNGTVCHFKIEIDGDNSRYILHREGNQPAVIKRNGCKEYWINGVFIGEIRKNGDELWYDENHQLHREGDLPASITSYEQVWYKHGKIHREADQPAVIKSDGTQVWYKDGALYRNADQPVIITGTGRKEWWREWEEEGVIHRVHHRDGDRPAVVDFDANQQIWYKNGLIHRESDQQAFIGVDGVQMWFQNGEVHRDGDRPAIIEADGSEKWYNRGKQIFLSKNTH